MRYGNSAYRGAPGGVDNALLYIYEGEHAYLHSARAGLKFDAGGWRVDTFLRQRADGFTQDRRPTSTTGMALREPGIDAGVAVRRSFSWGTPYVEATRDVSDRSEGYELKFGYWNDWTRGRFQVKPHAAVSLREARLNNFYYGVTPAEATAQRPAYAPGGGADVELALYGTYRLTETWQVVAGLSALRRASSVRSSPIVDDRMETTAMVGLLYDFSPAQKRWGPESPPLILRTFYGYSSDCKLINIVSLSCTSTHSVDHTDVWGLEAGRTLIKEPDGWPLDLAGFVGVVQHREKGFQDDFLQVNAYAKVHYWGFPWDRWVRTRLGFGAGLSYAEHIPESELREQAGKGRGTWKLLNYLEPTIDFRLGDVIPARALRDTYVGAGVSHRSGMFGKSRMFGDVNGGSNYIYGFIESSF
ncbi:MAG TPA: MipA/OmpV family protein [Burkholderiales bacterium]